MQILDLLADGEWHRPSELARRTGANVAKVLASLRSLSVTHSIARREYLVPRLHHGRDRVRKTSRLIVEYRLVKTATYPSFLLAPRGPVWK
jgi:DNA-binding IclR family transcriptional regulator